MTDGQVLILSSPGYPAFYPDNLDYTWIISAAGNGSFLLEFHELILMTKRPDLYVDKLTIGVGEDIFDDEVVLEEMNFFPTGTTIMIYVRHIWLRLQSDYKKYRQRGFLVDIERLDVTSKSKSFSWTTEDIFF